MSFDIAQLTDEIYHHHAWILPYTTTEESPILRARIRHPHWSIPQEIEPDSPLFIYRPKRKKPATRNIADIPWNAEHSTLLNTLQDIAQDRLHLQEYLHVMRLLVPQTNDTPQKMRIIIPIAPQLLHVNPLYPNDYTIIPPIPQAYPSFRLECPASNNHGTIRYNVPHRIPQPVIHAIRRLYATNSIPPGNIVPVPNSPSNQLNRFVTHISPYPSGSQHALIAHYRRWQEYYPDIPIPQL